MENPTFHLEGIIKSKNEMEDFEGPLSLILMLLAKNKIEIRDIRISDILDQYLDYISKMQEMDLEVASEFVQMASHLVYIKTRSLLTGENRRNWSCSYPLSNSNGDAYAGITVALFLFRGRTWPSLFPSGLSPCPVMGVQLQARQN